MPRIDFSEEQKEEISSAYLAGSPCSIIADKFGVGVNTIYSRLRQWGVQKKGPTPQMEYTLSKKDEIERMFHNYKTYNEIADRVGVSIYYISECINRWGLERSEYIMRSRPQRKYTVDPSCFDKLNEESLYWGGFLLADGNVYRQNRSDVFQMSLKDKEHLEKFLNFIGSNHPIRLRTRRGYKIFKIRISHLPLCKKMKKFGIIPRKSKIHTIPMINGVAYSRDFWRGIFDGDGSIFQTAQGYWHMSLVSGCRSLIWQFVRFLKHHGLGTNQIVKYRDMPKWQYNKTGRGACDVAALLYRDANIFLDRKKAAADKIMEKHASR